MSTNETPAGILTIKTGQNGYSPEQVADRAMTLETLIEELQTLLEDGVDPQTRVVVGGYGRGAVWEPAQRVELAESDDDDGF
jgi:hypothetical protein